MVLHRNTTVIVRLVQGVNNIFDIVTGVLQGDSLAPYLFTNNERQ